MSLGTYPRQAPDRIGHESEVPQDKKAASSVTDADRALFQGQDISGFGGESRHKHMDLVHLRALSDQVYCETSSSGLGRVGIHNQLLTIPRLVTCLCTRSLMLLDLQS